MKKFRSIYYFIAIILLMFIGSMHPYLTFVSVPLSGLIAILASYNFKNNEPDICFGIILLLCFQNLCIGLGAHIFLNHSDLLKYISQIPFMTILILWLGVIIRNISNKKWRECKSFKWFLIYSLCILISLFIGHGSIKSILINVRNMTVFFMAYQVGKNYITTKKQLDVFYKKTMFLIVIMFILGLVLWFFGYEAYKLIGIEEVYIAKGKGFDLSKLPGRFRTRIFVSLLDRMGSIYYEPVNLAYLFAFGLLMSIFYQQKKNIKNIIAIIICALGLILTFGKGGFLIVGLTIAYVIVSKILSKIFKNMSILNRNLFIFVIFILSIIIGIYFYVNIFTKSSALPHIWSIQRTFSAICANPFGYGLGTGGNMAAVFNDTLIDFLSSGEESTIMAFLYQIGIQGVFSLFICFIYLFNKQKKNDILSDVCFILPIVLLFVSLFQENTFTPQCIVAFMLFIGSMNSIFETNEINKIRYGKKKKVGIVTVYNSINSGSFWQAKSLEIYYTKKGFDVYYYKRNNNGSSYSVWSQLKTYTKYILNLKFNKFITSLKSYMRFRQEIKNFNIIDQELFKYMDIIVLGSDTIWNLDVNYFLKNKKIYFGDIFNNRNIITYAASSGNTNLLKYDYLDLKKSVSHWSKISVRDEYTKKLISKYTTKNIKLVCDPTMLLDKTDYLNYVKRKKYNNRYIFVYLFRRLSKNQNIILKEYAKKNGLIIINGTVANNYYDKQFINSPSDFVCNMMNADYILTDTFHGTVFSVIFRKQFIVVDRNKNKIKDLLKRIDLKERISSIDNDNLIFKNNIEYSKIEKKINHYISVSKKYLDDIN